MKFTAFLIFICSFQAVAVSVSSQQRIDLDLKKVSITEVLKSIEQRYDYRFVYNDEIKQSNQKLDLYTKRATIDHVMQQLLANTSFSYKKINNGLLVIIALPGQNAAISIEGKVVNDKGAPVSGVSVIEKGTSNGTVTREDGSFSLEVANEEAVLVLSTIGFVTREISIKNNDYSSIVLQTTESAMDEVVVIGYGTTTKRDLTGAISTIKTNPITGTQYNTVDALIRGRAAGVQVTQAGGAPGGALSIRIRGTNSLRSDNEPLYVVDGIIMSNNTADNSNAMKSRSSNNGQDEQNTLSGINTQDIENIQILKDASATAIYGSRGANGVILITTKKGGINARPRINLLTSVEVARASRHLDVLDGRRYAKYMNELAIAQNLDTVYYPNPDNVESIDWQKELQQTAITQNYRLNVSGSSKDQGTKYFVAGGYKGIEGIVKNTGNNSGDFRVNLHQKISPRVNFDFTASGQRSFFKMTQSSEPLGFAQSSLISMMLSAPPITTAQVSLDDADQPYMNPYAMLTDHDDFATEKRILSSLATNVKISDVFSYKLNLAIDSRDKERKRWYGTKTFIGKQANGSLSLSDFSRDYFLIENLLFFNKKFNSNHRIDGTVGVTYDKEMITSSSVVSENFFTEALRTDGFGYGQVIFPYLRDKTEISIFSGLARVNYSFKNKYTVTLTGRGDGTSKFAKGNKFSFFPAVAAAWRLTDEPFLKSIKDKADLKLRLGYGESGNQAISPYGTFARYNSINYVSGNTVVTGVVPQNIQNDNLRWETTQQFNGGIDAKLFNGALSLTVDAYHKVTRDLLQNFTIPVSTGYASMPYNIGSIQNKGIEFTLNSIVADKKDFKGNVSANIGINRNKILDLGLPETVFGTHTWEAYIGPGVSNGTYFKEPANIFIVGQPIGMFYGYQTNGVFKDGDDIKTVKYFGQPVKYGDLRFVDQNGDNNITPDDKVLIGNPHPKFTYGFGGDFEIKRFSVNLFFNGVYGNQIANGNMFRIGQPNGVYNSNILSSVYENAWRADRPTNDPRIGSDNLYLVDRYIESGSFLRLATASLGYNIPLNKNTFIKTIALNVIGRNLFTITNYSGFDPEVNSFPWDPGKIGIDWNSYPNMRAVTFALNLTF